MNREYEFSVVVFAKDTAKLYRTFKNVREVTPEGTVQILAVCIAGDMDIPDERDMRELEEAGEKEKELKDEELDKIYGEFNPEDPRFREMLDDRDLLYIDGLECGDLVAELKDKIAGSYVVFAKAGIRFSPKSSAEIRRCFEEENRDVVLTKIRGKGNIYVREHNNYCNRFTEKTTLDNNVYLLHQLYTAYTFAADQVKWVSEIRPEIWYLDVMTMVYLPESGSGFRGRYLCADPCGPSHGGGLEEYAAGSGPAGGILSGIFPKDRRLQNKRKSCS